MTLPKYKKCTPLYPLVVLSMPTHSLKKIQHLPQVAELWAQLQFLAKIIVQQYL